MSREKEIKPLHSMWRGNPGDFCVIGGVLHIFSNAMGYIPTEVFKLPWDMEFPDGPIPSYLREWTDTKNGIILDPVFIWKKIR